MSEENKEIQKEECFCKNKYFRNFLTISLGTFVGGFCALNLFTALNKPPMFPPAPYFHKMHYSQLHHGGFKKHDCDCKCHKKFMKKHFEGKRDLKDFKNFKEIKKDKTDYKNPVENDD